MTFPRKTLTIVANLTLILTFWATTIAIAAPLQAKQQQENEDFVYNVRAGDTLLLIALRYNLNPIEIALANNLSNPNLIFPGQKLILPGIEIRSFQTKIPTPIGDKVHIIQPGESLSSIAGLYDVSVSHLLLLNEISNPDLIEIGRTLQIPTTHHQPPDHLSPPLKPLSFQSQPSYRAGH